MAKPKINVFVEPKLKVSIAKEWLKRVVLAAFKVEGIEGAVEVGLVITDDETVQQLNKTYRDVDEPTDVLAFQMMASDENQGSDLAFVSPPDGLCRLGEVIISYPQALKQAQERGDRVTQELALLIVHGVLHLLGYDHEYPEDEQRMRAKEREAVEKLETIEG